MSEIAFVLRSLRRAPLFSFLAIACVAIGIASVATMTRIVSVLLLQPPPGLTQPAALGTLAFNTRAPGQASSGGGNNMPRGVSLQALQRLRNDLAPLAAVAGVHDEQMSLERGAAAQPINVQFVTAEYFATLGVVAELGRLLDTDWLNDAATIPPVVISGALWRTRFGADGGIVGKTILIGKARYQVLGVVGRGYEGVTPGRAIQAWLPIGAAVHELLNDNRAVLTTAEALVQPIVRVNQGVAPGQVEAAATTVETRWYAERYGAMLGSMQLEATYVPLIPGLDGRSSSTDARVSVWLLLIASLVALVAASNSASLWLVRGAARSRELRIRTALGAPTGALIRLFAIEAVIVCVVGALAAVACQRLVLDLVRNHLLRSLPAPDGVVDSPTFGVIAVTALVLIITAVVVPFFQRPRDSLGAAARLPSGQDGRPRRSVLLALQVSVSTALLSCALIALTSWSNLRATELGLRVDRVIVGQMSLRRYASDVQDMRRLFDIMADSVRAVPGVRGLSRVLHVPFIEAFAVPIQVPDAESDRLAGVTRSRLGPEFNAVDPEFFAVAGVRLVRGRLLDRTDVAGGEPVVVVNQTAANVLWPAQDAIGRCIRFPSMNGKATDCARVVGIVSDAKSTSLRLAPDLQIYASLAQRVDLPPTALLVSVASDQPVTIRDIEAAMVGASPNLPYATARPFSEYVGAELRPFRAASAIFAAFAGGALLLAALGLYGTFSLAVSQRIRELGIRAALGATPMRVVRPLLSHGLTIIGSGATFGLIVAFALGRLLTSRLFEVQAPATWLFVVSWILASAVALVAVGLPALRAARVDPIIAIRQD